MSRRVFIDVARARAHAVLVQATKRCKADLSERLRLMSEAASEE